MNTNAECAECARWWSDYEAATMEEFRTHSRLQIARYSHDWEAISRLEAEAATVTERRARLRKALVVHQKSHPPALAA
jgi:hypothetical protein